MEKSADAFRTISEVSEILGTPAHVLRFWESRFPQIRPVKRAGGRRYYRPSDVALLGGIKRLLHDEGLTIRGVQKVLREQGIRHVAGLTLSPEAKAVAAVTADSLADADHEAALLAAPTPSKRKATAVRRPADPSPADAGDAAAPRAQAEPLPLWASMVEQAADRPDPSSPEPTRQAKAEPGDAAGPEVWLPVLLRAMPPAEAGRHRERLAHLHDRLLHLRNRVADAARRPAP